jgi:hypothetical protein
VVCPDSKVVYLVPLEGGRTARVEVPIECADAVMDADVRAITEHRPHRERLALLA